MIKFFRKIRQNLLSEGKTGKYLKYAIGEIVLVVIGIMIALQVNNWNIENTDKDKEAKYLSNIVLDLKKDISRLDYLIEFRKGRLIGDQEIIDHMNGYKINNLNKLTKYVVNSLMEENFTPNNTTFFELSNSGNLNLISNDSIKFLLLELEEVYKLNRLNMEHERFDYREYISKPIIKNTHIDHLFPVYLGSKTIEEQKITMEHFSTLLENKAYKNGLYIMSIMSNDYISEYEKIKTKSKIIIELIESEK
jgi:hypothetical protein